MKMTPHIFSSEFALFAITSTIKNIRGLIEDCLLPFLIDLGEGLM